MALDFFKDKFASGLRLMAVLIVINPLHSADRIGLAASGSPGSPQASAAAPIPLEPVYRLKFSDGKQRLATRGEIDAEKMRSRLDGVAFLAVSTNVWPAGLVPLFATETTNRFELRRRPPRGQENSTEPLFFALPSEDEPDAFKLAGRWECHATRGDGSKVRLAWELAIERDKVSGRFDQNTDYRFAFITAGTFRSNWLELRVEYGVDAYVLTGKWHDGKLTGDWRRTDDSERGSWEALRGTARTAASRDTVALFEWRRASDGALRYAVDGERMEAGWERSSRALCRVWREPMKGKDQ